MRAVFSLLLACVMVACSDNRSSTPINTIAPPAPSPSPTIDLKTKADAVVTLRRRLILLGVDKAVSKVELDGREVLNVTVNCHWYSDSYLDREKIIKRIVEQWRYLVGEDYYKFYEKKDGFYGDFDPTPLDIMFVNEHDETIAKIWMSKHEKKEREYLFSNSIGPCVTLPPEL